MELETVRLFAADAESNKLITRLHDDIIFCRGECLLMNVILVSSREGLVLIDDIILLNEPAHRNIVFCLNRELEIKSSEHYQSILYPSDIDGKDAFQAVKDFLYVFRYNIEIHGMIGFDFNDFMSIISGRKLLSIQIVEFANNFTEGICQFNKTSHISFESFLLSFYFKSYDDFTMNQRELYDFMDLYQTSDDTIIEWNLHEDKNQRIMLMATKPI